MAGLELTREDLNENIGAMTGADGRTRRILLEAELQAELLALGVLVVQAMIFLKKFASSCSPHKEEASRSSRVPPTDALSGRDHRVFRPGRGRRGGVAGGGLPTGRPGTAVLGFVRGVDSASYTPTGTGCSLLRMLGQTEPALPAACPRARGGLLRRGGGGHGVPGSFLKVPGEHLDTQNQTVRLPLSL